MENYLKVIWKKNYGVMGEISIELSHGKALPVDKSLTEFNLIIDQIEGYIEHLEINRLPAMKTNYSATNLITKLVDAKEIRVTMDKGKKYYKVACGEWTEFGVPFWPEHIKESGIQVSQIPDTGHICKEGTKALVEMVDNKPKRILKLIAATT